MTSMPPHDDLSELPVTIYQRDGRTFAVIHALNAIADGRDAEDAISRVRDGERARRAQFSAAGASISAPRPKQITPFLVKIAGAALAIVVVLVTADLVAQRAFSDLPRRVAAMGFATVDELGQLSQWISDDRKRELGRSVRILLENLGPVLDEIRPLFAPQGAERMKGDPGQ